MGGRGDIERGIPLHNRQVNKVHPLPVDILNTYPIEKYSPSLVKNGSCAICLDDFVVDKNEIRVLPCGHGFCTGCIGKFSWPLGFQSYIVTTNKTFHWY